MAYRQKILFLLVLSVSYVCASDGQCGQQKIFFEVEDESDWVRISAKRGSRLVGHIKYARKEHSDGTMRGKIGFLEVDERWQRQGIGSVLFHTALRQMYLDGCGEVRWDAYEDAVAFYYKQGAILTYGSECPFLTTMHIEAKSFDQAKVRLLLIAAKPLGRQ